MNLGFDEELILAIQGLLQHGDSCVFNCMGKTIQIANKQNQHSNECQRLAYICLPQLAQKRCKREIQPEL